MSTVLDAEPIVDEADVVAPLSCDYLLCTAAAAWSALFTCGETILYCDEHLEWMKRQGSVSCICPGTEGRSTRLAMVVPL